MNRQPKFFTRSLQILAFGLTTAVVLVTTVAHANLSISPLVIELDSRQGQAQGTITVGNSGSEAFRARSYAVPFTYDRETGFQQLRQTPTDLTSYLQFSPPEVSVPGVDKRRVRFITRLAPSLPDGEYRAMIFTETLTPIAPPEVVTSGETTFTTTIVPRLGVAVYVRKGKLSPKLTVEGLRFDAQQQQPQLLVKNAGKATAIVTSEWAIKQGERVVRKGFVQDTTVIAEGDRYVKVALPNPETNTLQPGEYQLQGNLLWGFNQSQKIPYKFPFTVPPRS
jgi:P pilus assembly chaperone PapD